MVLLAWGRYKGPTFQQLEEGFGVCDNIGWGLQGDTLSVFRCILQYILLVCIGETLFVFVPTPTLAASAGTPELEDCRNGRS